MASKDWNQITASKDRCHVHSTIVAVDSIPELANVGDNPIFQKVFGTMEQLRIEETNRCLKIKSREERQRVREYNKNYRSKRRAWKIYHALRRKKNPADLKFSVLVRQFYNQQLTEIGLFE